METTKTNWYENLTAQCNSLAEKFGLDDLGTQELREFIMGISKSQFKAGNKSGIRWAYQKQSGQSAPAAA